MESRVPLAPQGTPDPPAGPVPLLWEDWEREDLLAPPVPSAPQDLQAWSSLFLERRAIQDTPAALGSEVTLVQPALQDPPRSDTRERGETRVCRGPRGIGVHQGTRALQDQLVQQVLLGARGPEVIRVLQDNKARLVSWVTPATSPALQDHPGPEAFLDVQALKGKRGSVERPMKLVLLVLLVLLDIQDPQGPPALRDPSARQVQRVLKDVEVSVLWVSRGLLDVKERKEEQDYLVQSADLATRALRAAQVYPAAVPRRWSPVS